MRGPVAWWNDPWRPAAGFWWPSPSAIWLWSLLPVLIAVIFSFNDGKSRTTWQGFSFRWYWGDQTRSVWHDATLHQALLQTLNSECIATLITVPLGVLFAIGIDRWRGRLPAGANMLMLVSFVIPEVLLAVALLFAITSLALPITLGTSAQVVGLITFQIAYPAVLVRARRDHRQTNMKKQQWIWGPRRCRHCAASRCPCFRRSSPVPSWCSPT